MAAIAEPIGLKSGQYLCRLRAKDREVVSSMMKSFLESYGLCYEPNAADEDAILVEKYYFEGDRGEFWVVPGGRHGRKDCRVFGVLRELRGRKMR